MAFSFGTPSHLPCIIPTGGREGNGGRVSVLLGGQFVEFVVGVQERKVVAGVGKGSSHFLGVPYR
jgi:hypothetical protein